MSNYNHTAGETIKGVWYTYVGSGGAAVVAFLWILLLLTWIFSVLKWG